MSTLNKKVKKLITTGRVKARAFIVVVSILTLAVSLEIGMQVRNNRKKVDASSSILVEQIAEQIHSNVAREEALSDTHKDSCLIRANSAAYIIDNNDIYLHSVVKMKTIADVVDVDEINIFNEDGIIYAGTNPEYYGISMDSGDQIGFFKPMLEDKNKSMCQDPQYNTVSQKMMMYACVWNASKTRIYQIGISPTRLIEELEITGINSIVNDIPYRSAMTVFIADADTGEILGSTSENYEGMNLADLSMYRDDVLEGDSYRIKAVVNGEACYTIVYNEGNYLIAAAQSMFTANQDIAFSTLIMLFFLISAILLLLYFINTSVDKVREQETLYLREVEKERASRLETTINDIMKDALDQTRTRDGIKIVVREVAKELGAKACMLYAEDPMMGLEPLNIKWSMMPDGTDEFIPVEQEAVPRDTWTWCISTDGNAVIYDVDEIRELSADAYEVCRNIDAEKVAIISFINQYRAIGYMSIVDPNIERMEDIAMVMKQMSKFVISLLKIKSAFDKLTYLGFNDSLTHAFNRHALDERADRLEAGSVIALIFCDITGLKRVNDEKGHDEGDRLIINSYKALEEEFGSNDVYRVGGDEFICLLEDITNAQLDEIVSEFEASLAEKEIEMSVGAAWTGDYAGDFAYLERAADANMYTKKVEYYRKHPELKREIFERRQSQEMRAMIDNLANAYPIVGTLNLVDGSFRIIKCIDEMMKEASKHTHFNDLIRGYRENAFTQESVRRIKDVNGLSDIVRMLSENDRFEYKYQLKSGYWQQIVYQVIERNDERPVRAIFYANNISAALAESLDQDVSKYNEYELLDGLCNDYSIISIIDRSKNSIKVYRYNDFPEKVAEGINKLTFDQTISWYADNFVADSDREKFLYMSNLDVIDEHMNDKNYYSYIFKTNSAFRGYEKGSYARFYFYKPDKDSDTYVFATRDISKEIDLLLSEE